MDKKNHKIERKVFKQKNIKKIKLYVTDLYPGILIGGVSYDKQGNRIKVAGEPFTEEDIIKLKENGHHTIYYIPTEQSEEKVREIRRKRNSSQTARILIVDDLTYILKLLTDILHKAGHEIHSAKDGMEAWDLFSKLDFDLVITDIKMSGGDGITFSKKVKEVDPDIPIIFLTAHGGPDNVKQAGTIGVNAVLTKPIKNDLLLERVRKLLSITKNKPDEQD